MTQTGLPKQWKFIFSEFLRLDSSGSMYWQGLASGETSLPGLQMALFLLCPHLAERVRDRDRDLFLLEGNSPIRLGCYP